MTISANKTRYTMALTTTNVQRFQKAAKQLGMPLNVMSLVCDDTIRETAEIFEKMASKGTVKPLDFFRLLGERMFDLFEEGKDEGDALRQARDTISRP